MKIRISDKLGLCKLELKRDLSEVTRQEIKELAKEIWKELRKDAKGEWGRKSIKQIEEWYPEEMLLGPRRDKKVIFQIITWFIHLRFSWKCTIEEAKGTIGDALTISTNLDESVLQCYDEHDEYKEDLDFESRDHEFVDNVYQKLRDRGFKVYRRKRPQKRKEIPKEKIRELRRQGLTLREISKKLDIPKSTIHDFLKTT